MKAPQTKSVIIPDGTYRALLKHVEEKQKQFGDEPPQEGIRFVYDCYLPDGKTVELSRHLTLTCGLKSILRKDLTALVGDRAFNDAIKSDSAFTALIDTLIGKEVLLATETKTSLSGNDYTNILSVARMPQRAAQQAGKKQFQAPPVKREILPSAADGLVSLGEDDDPPF